MKVQDAAFVKNFIRMADDGYNQGWHERNGGNLSYRIKKEEIESIKKELNFNSNFISTGIKSPQLSSECFLVTGTGKYFRNIAADPQSCAGIIEIDEKGKQYRIIWGLENGRPTSELPSHLLNHETKKIATNGIHRVMYHCHPANLIALTFILPLDEKVFTKELWDMMPECPVIFPGGIGVVQWMIPGSSEIAEASSNLMKEFDVIVWAHHGLFCSGEDFDSAFGLAHTVEKASEILVKVLSVRPQKLQSITTQQLKSLAAAFKLDLPERFVG